MCSKKSMNNTGTIREALESSNTTQKCRIGTTGSRLMSIQQDKITIVVIFAPSLSPLLRYEKISCAYLFACFLSALLLFSDTCAFLHKCRNPQRHSTVTAFQAREIVIHQVMNIARSPTEKVGISCQQPQLN